MEHESLKPFWNWFQFGVDSRLQLDYWWDHEYNDEKCTEKVSNPAALIESNKKQKLSQSLNKLISIAKLYMNKEKVRFLHYVTTRKFIVHALMHMYIVTWKEETFQVQIILFFKMLDLQFFCFKVTVKRIFWSQMF